MYTMSPSNQISQRAISTGQVMHNQVKYYYAANANIVGSQTDEHKTLRTTCIKEIINM